VWSFSCPFSDFYFQLADGLSPDDVDARADLHFFHDLSAVYTGAFKKARAPNKPGHPMTAKRAGLRDQIATSLACCEVNGTTSGWGSVPLPRIVKGGAPGVPFTSQHARLVGDLVAQTARLAWSLVTGLVWRSGFP